LHMRGNMRFDSLFTNMTEDVLFEGGDVSITRKVARFGHTVYQIANISAVSVANTRRMNVAGLTFISFGIGILVAGVIAGVFIIGTGLRSGISIWFYAVGLACILVGIAIQLIRPRRCFVLTLTTIGGDVEALASEDNEHVAAVERALEKAFAERP
jgi:MFS family permease